MTHRAALARLLPNSLTTEGGDPNRERWQHRKSRETRNAVLEAALDCLADHGYAGCSLQIVARRAGLSRGAMLHHYTSKLDLMAAVIEYAFYKRMEDFLRRIRTLTEVDRSVRSAGVAISYEICNTREYRAYLELNLASRSDTDLRAIFLDRARHYDAVWREEIEKVFPEWAGDDRLDMLNDYVWAVVEGLALNADIWDDPDRAEMMLQFVANTIRAVRLGKLDVPAAKRG